METTGKERMNDNIDGISINYEEDGVLLVKELKKIVLSKGAWATIMFLYQEFDRANQNYKPSKVSLRRYQKKEGNYIQRSKFNISSEKQAHMIAKNILDWYPKKPGSDDLTAPETDSDE
jgi:hypothetical protein